MEGRTRSPDRLSYPFTRIPELLPRLLPVPRLGEHESASKQRAGRDTPDLRLPQKRPLNMRGG